MKCGNAIIKTGLLQLMTVREVGLHDVVGSQTML
jgi:hypothetical protein